MLTRKQSELLLFINQRLQEQGVAPSFDEMKEALGLSSKSGIHRLITALEERGFIRRLAHRARALEVLRLPEAAAHTAARPQDRDTTPHDGPGAVARLPAPGARAHAPDRFRPNVIRGDFRSALGGVAAPGGESAELPLYGRIAAGTPIEALRDHSETVSVPGTLLGQGEHYCLEVAGDSMEEAGILDGDTVIIRRSDTAENGRIVVALVDDAEVTLKRLRRRGGSIALEPANAAYETRIFPPDRVKVQGELVGLLRRYH